MTPRTAVLLFCRVVGFTWLANLFAFLGRVWVLRIALDQPKAPLITAFPWADACRLFVIGFGAIFLLVLAPGLAARAQERFPATGLDPQVFAFALGATVAGALAGYSARIEGEWGIEYWSLVMVFGSPNRIPSYYTAPANFRGWSSVASVLFVVMAILILTGYGRLRSTQ